MTQIETHLRFEAAEPELCDDCEEQPATIEVWADHVDLGQGTCISELCRACALLVCAAVGIDASNVPPYSADLRFRND